MPYQELVKNFEKVRAYMRDFYVYGFKSRTGYDAKSARSYDDERRRIESWLGDWMRFSRSAEGKRVFLSVDSRRTQHDPLYKAWKTKSFTDGDITLHFLLFDILYDPAVKMTLAELVRALDERLAGAMTFDESTLRKKLKEYVREGLLCAERQGRRVLYGRSADVPLTGLADVIDFFSEAAPCGVVGSYLGDRLAPHRDVFWFKHHYMTPALDSDVLATLFAAMREKRAVTVQYYSRRARGAGPVRLVPLKIYISAQNGRQNLIAYREEINRLQSYRLDFMADVRLQEECPKFDALRASFAKVEAHMWGVNCRWDRRRLEHVEFVVQAQADEPYIVRRLEREKRCGRVQRLDATHYRYTADVFDSNELLPWIRTFLCRITAIRFSNRTVGERFKADLREMYRLYGLDGPDGPDGAEGGDGA